MKDLLIFLEGPLAPENIFATGRGCDRICKISNSQIVNKQITFHISTIHIRLHTHSHTVKGYRRVRRDPLWKECIFIICRMSLRDEEECCWHAIRSISPSELQLYSSILDIPHRLDTRSIQNMLVCMSLSL